MKLLSICLRRLAVGGTKAKAFKYLISIQKWRKESGEEGHSPVVESCQLTDWVPRWAKGNGCGRGSGDGNGNGSGINTMDGRLQGSQVLVRIYTHTLALPLWRT